MSSYFFLVNNALIFAPSVLKKLPIVVKPFFKAAPRSENVFFFTTNQKIANPPIPASSTEPITIPAIAPPESPFFAAGASLYTAVRVVAPVTLKV